MTPTLTQFASPSLSFRMTRNGIPEERHLSCSSSMSCQHHAMEWTDEWRNPLGVTFIHHFWITSTPVTHIIINLEKKCPICWLLLSLVGNGCWDSPFCWLLPSWTGNRLCHGRFHVNARLSVQLDTVSYRECSLYQLYEMSKRYVSILDTRIWIKVFL